MITESWPWKSEWWDILTTITGPQRVKTPFSCLYFVICMECFVEWWLNRSYCIEILHPLGPIQGPTRIYTSMSLDTPNTIHDYLSLYGAHTVSIVVITSYRAQTCNNRWFSLRILEFENITDWCFLDRDSLHRYYVFPLFNPSLILLCFPFI